MKQRESKKSLPNTVNHDSTHKIPRNVNHYSHFLQEPYITEKDIQWVLELRDLSNTDLRQKLAHIPNSAFQVNDKTIEAKKEKHLPRDIKYNGNSTPVLHLLKCRLGPTANLGQVEFETGLRSYNNDKGILKKEREWTTIPKTTRKQEFPEFLPNYREEMNKRKSQSQVKLEKITYSGFDPDTNYPQYVMKFNDKNIQNVRHLFVPNTKMSVIQWQEGLRPLQQIKKDKKK